MGKEKTKVYLYTRVSTSMQIDGYSLDAQKSRMKAFCEFNDYEIAGEYEDAGKSGKSIEGRVAFNNMMEDIKSGKDDVSFVLVFKLSRFGRNAADVLNSLQIMQDFGVNLICVEDGIDSSKEAGRLMISVLSAVAEIERENIRVQTMEGRMQKAREGKWNGGFAPYGYALVDGKLEINEEEAVAIRTIFDQYVNTDMGSNGIAKYLENHGIHKIARQNGKNFYYGCKHRNMTRGHKCDYRKQVSEIKLDGAVVEVLRKLVSNKKFAGMMREKINMEVDTTVLDQEISAQEKTLRQSYLNKDAILSDFDNLDYEDMHYKRRKADLEDRLSKTYDKIEETENALVEAKAKKRSILAEKVCGDNIYKALIFFDKMYEPMNEAERREFLTQFIEKVEIYEEEQANGQWLKSIEFKLPIISKDMKISLDNGSQIETVVLMSKVK